MLDFDTLLIETVQSGQCLGLVLSKRRPDADVAADKLSVRPVMVGGETRYQWAARVGRQETHENLTPAETVERVRRLFGAAFEHCHLFTPTADYAARRRSDGAITVKSSRPTRQAAPVAHDRAKQYLIPENVPCPFLAEIGVMTADGRVRAAKYHKFRQINRFLELVDDIVPSLPLGTVNVVDFGCGKSYLTFALHHLLTRGHGRTVRIVGLDRNPAVIRDCRQIAERLGCAGLRFHVGDIARHEADEPVHLAVSLHACDTATDDALAKAVGWQADVILAVPCCQHELAARMQPPDLSPLVQHGILKERFAALATDALRAKALELCGYRTQVVEFIEMEHTPKNLLLRAVRRPGDIPDRAARLAEFQSFKRTLGLERIYLEDVLKLE